MHHDTIRLKNGAKKAPGTGAILLADEACRQAQKNTLKATICSLEGMCSLWL
jgi:hypothetical protein